MNEHDKLFADFPPVNAEAWEAKIREDLKGADYEKKLVKKTLDNITIKPFYTTTDLVGSVSETWETGKQQLLAGHKDHDNTWEIRQDIRVYDIDAAVQKIRMAAEHGVTTIGIDLTLKEDWQYADFLKLITSVDLNQTTLSLMAGAASLTCFDFLKKALDGMSLTGTSLKGSVEYDPLGHLTRSGGFYRTENEDIAGAAELLSSARDQLSHFRVLAVNSHLFADSGASAVQELAFGLSMITEYIDRLTDRQITLADITGHIQWNLGIGSDYFMEIAKIRAARLLFTGLLNSFESKETVDSGVFIHSITTGWNKTLYDPNVNMLRLTTEAMAAILGGCDSLLVKPYDSWYKEPGEFSERLARNIQVILKEESHFDKVKDPAAGSYYIESLTNSLVEHAWNLFLQVEDRGGYSKAFASGFIGEDIRKMVAKRLDMVASRREVLVGTNQYPNFTENMLADIVEDIAFPIQASHTRKIAEPLLPARASTGFEKIRLGTEKHPGKRPIVFMLTYGNLAMRLARSQFACNFFACAGYKVIDNLGFESVEEGVKAAFQAKADIIVVCSSDEEYAGAAPAVVSLTDGRAIVVVAGAPTCMEELKKKGITDFIHIRSNVLEVLQNFQLRLGIS